MTRTPIRQSFPAANRRAILFGLILLPFEVYWVTVAEMKYGSQATALPLFIYPVLSCSVWSSLTMACRYLSAYVSLLLLTCLLSMLCWSLAPLYQLTECCKIYSPLWFTLTVLLLLKTIGEIYFFTTFHGTLPLALPTS